MAFRELIDLTEVLSTLKILSGYDSKYSLFTEV